MILSRVFYFLLNYLLLICFYVSCISCGGGVADVEINTNSTNSDDYTVRVHLKGNPDVMNGILAQSAQSNDILTTNVHCGLLEPDPVTFELRPYLAVARPEIKVLENGNMSMNFEIREEAVWDNGTPITAEDVAFTIKTVKNPKVNAAPIRSFFEFVEDVIIDDNNPKKFTVICNKSYFMAEFIFSTYYVYPAYFYDAQGFMSGFSIPELNDPANLEQLNANPRIIDFAEEFNTKYNHEPKMIVGAGPYQITEVATHQIIKLERKKEWWGDNVDIDYIAAYPTQILFKIIDDDNTSILSLKEQELDVMTYVPEAYFLELKENKRASDHFNFYAKNSFAYRYIGINMNKSKLKDVRVRKAIAHLVDKQLVADELCNGLASIVDGPVSPLKKYYNHNIPKVEFSVSKAKSLLSEAGWFDTDGDNILDKVVDGKRIPLNLKFVYPQGKQFYKDIAQILKDEAARVGIQIDMASSEWAVLMDDLKGRNFDLICLGWGQTPFLDDFKQIWHTSSDTYEGSNRVGFGNHQTDLLIDNIRETIDESKRNEMYLRFQEIVAEHQPYIFLVAPKLCTAISKRFKNTHPSALRPGYFVRLFQLAEK